MARICVVGTGYVGLVTGACFAELGHRVACIDIDQDKIALLKTGAVPIYEPWLKTLIHRNVKAQRLSFSTSYAEITGGADFVFICVGTPSTSDSKVDLSYLHQACIQVSNAIPSGKPPIIVNKSTVPPGTGNMLRHIMARSANGKGAPPFVSNPEFLREGRAVIDFMNPNRVIIGSEDTGASKAVAALYRPLDCPILMVSTTTAEMVKYASNAFLATKISFVNEIATLCEELGIDVEDVSRGIGLDPRVGKDFLKAGIGFGGSCLPKDLSGLIQLAESHGHSPRLLNAVVEINAQQPNHFLLQIEKVLGTLKAASIAVLGVTFKAETDDIRTSPALELIKTLLYRESRVTAYDPQGAKRAAPIFPDAVQWAKGPYEAAQGCDALVIGAEWPEFQRLDLKKLRLIMKGNIIADGRNCLDRQDVERAGFRYLGVGRGTMRPYHLKTSDAEPALLA